jgi:hypothetical protein
MTAHAVDLRRTLKRFGFADRAVDAAWPRWWSDDADASASARAELTFSVARNLGIDPTSLLTLDGEPRFVWRPEARFKRVANENERELAGITAFGRAVATAVAVAAPDPQAVIEDASPARLRAEILASGRPYVDLGDLLSLCWVIGIPVVHLRVFPWPQKRMAAMIVPAQQRPVMLLAKDASYPPAIAFYVAHELAHVALGHLGAEEIIVDLDEADDPISRRGDERDDEEAAADRFALELLTGSPEPEVVASGATANATRLAAAAHEAAGRDQIEPGVVAELYGFATDDWKVAVGALKAIYREAKPVWKEINALALSELDLGLLPRDSADYLIAVMGVGGTS